MDAHDVRRWVEDYERAWRSPGTEALAELFTADATYLPSPWARPVTGLEAIATFWETEREGPEESFALRTRVLAVDGDTAVVRAEVDYASAEVGRWRDLWVLRLEDGRCAAFEEWPFAPATPDGHPTSEASTDTAG